MEWVGYTSVLVASICVQGIHCGVCDDDDWVYIYELEVEKMIGRMEMKVILEPTVYPLSASYLSKTVNSSDPMMGFFISSTNSSDPMRTVLQIQSSSTVQTDISHR
ncbi:hypothetical protein HanIR_Chr13g0650571 [Helianthus annuus]|nr:hypothetical protein HanIR_Chr13g0650571 [Helianthus annuus]